MNINTKNHSYFISGTSSL